MREPNRVGAFYFAESFPPKIVFNEKEISISFFMRNLFITL